MKRIVIMFFYMLYLVYSAKAVSSISLVLPNDQLSLVQTTHVPSVWFNYTHQYQTLTYYIIDSIEHKVSVGYGGNTQNVSGNLVIPDSVEYCGIKYAVTEIGWQTFLGRNITSITLPEGLEVIGDGAFYGTALSSVYIPASVNTIKGCPFGYCNYLTTITVSTNNPIYDSRNNCNAIVKTNENKLIVGCRNTVIPSTISTIGELAFYRCSNINTIVIPYGVTTIERSAFYNSGLSSITIPNSVSSIGWGAFENCTNLQTITLSNSISIINDYLFYGCINLESITIPNSVTKIGYQSFRNCSHIYHELVIPNTVDSIGDWAFAGCSELPMVTVGKSVSYIGDSAFSGCTNILSFKMLPNNPPRPPLFWFDNPSQNTPLFFIPYCNIPNYQNSWNTWGQFFLWASPIDLNITVDVNDTLRGEVSIIQQNGYNVACDSSVSITAIANYGYHLSSWSDGDTNNPRVVYLVQDTSLIAIFNKNTYSLIAIANYPDRGEVSHIGTRQYLDTSVITAIPNYGYHFTNWGDGQTTNPRSFIITQDTSFYAVFEKNNYNIFLTADSTIHGIVSGAGIYEYLDNRIISATANYGYHFTQWSDGNTDNPRTITLTQDTSLIAQFTKNQYTINSVSSNTVRGNVTGDTIAYYLDTITLTANVEYGYHFTQWNDGNTDNPRSIVVTKDTVFMATFEKNSYSITLTVDTTIHGNVSGAGIYEYLDSRNISATANYGYHFTLWNDGNTYNPRTITLTQDTSFTAQFAPNQYTITGTSANATRGIVTGGTSVDYLDSITLTATANYGYHFDHWNDMNTDNPRQVQVTQDQTYTAYFDYNQYGITLNVDTSIHGTCSGGGNYNYLSNRTITATANYGYHFTQWSDGNTNNPRTITLTQDTSFTALFSKNQYTVDVAVSHSERGSVTGGATVEYLDSVTIVAIPNYGYHFTAWNDGDATNPRTIETIKDSLFTAYFGYDQYSITLNVDTNIHGLVTGGGLYNYTSEQTITATPNYGYHFTSWNDGDTTNPRTITLTQDTAFTALFAKNLYSISVVSADTIRGNVTGNTTMEYLNSVSIAATANYGYHFLHWNDGDTTNPRVITLTQDTLLSAFFAKNWYTVIGISENETMGYVTGSDTVEYLDSVSLLATSNYGYHFSSWDDGNTNNPRLVCVTQDTSFTALFEKKQYTLTVQSNDEIQGSVSDGGVFDYLDTATIIASASEHYHFVRWDDGNMDNPREYVIVGDATLTAIFAIDTHTVTVTANDIARGMAEATGTEYVYGTPCTVTATAYTGYVFSRWSNGITANPYTFAVLEDTELTAIFEEEGTQGIDDVATTDNIRIFSMYDRILIDGLNGQDVTIYTIDGRIIASLPKATEHVAIPVTTTGVYFVKVGEHPARKVVMIR